MEGKRGKSAANADSRPMTILDILLAERRLDDGERQRVLALSAADGRAPDQVLLDLGLVTPLERAAALARHHGVPLLRGDDLADDLPDSAGLSPHWLLSHRLLPVGLDDSGLLLAAVDPVAADVLDAVELTLGQQPRLCFMPQPEWEAAFQARHGGGASALDRILDDAAADQALEEAALDRLKDQASEAPVVRLVAHLIDEAVKARASDIHIEPFADALVLRYRIDGVLQNRPPPPPSLTRALVSRIKILAGLDIAERRLPQDGRVRHRMGGRLVDLRVSTLPTVHGESVVIRVLDGSVGAMELSGLGLDAADEAALRRMMASPHGLVLVTGPTGSGKTTTLYAALRLIDAATRKVLTVEDPVEYQMARVNQVQVHPAIGLGFATVLRSMLRQNPDVILVGETRDTETADIAVQAALTGHLVLTTLHTNSAAGAVTRLLEMGVEPFLIASTLRGVVGQRLVRLLCPRCKAPEPADAAALSALRDAGLLAPGAAAPLLLGPVGCPHCGGTGYAGRVGIFEMLRLDEGLRRLVVERASTGALEVAARAAGMRSMRQHGLSRVLAGLTSFAEVARVTEMGD
ncbi:type II secretion system protein E (GspE) [Azospirillum sp. RU38E]|nr:type II secretion system protein E (GspE) [Azospirillum sp. RU38E]SNS72463.1 type II secretion system protein E (GspE) [Azospirillum sp. RU37A]